MASFAIASASRSRLTPSTPTLPHSPSLQARHNHSPDTLCKHTLQHSCRHAARTCRRVACPVALVVRKQSRDVQASATAATALHSLVSLFGAWRQSVRWMGAGGNRKRVAPEREGACGTGRVVRGAWYGARVVRGVWHQSMPSFCRGSSGRWKGPERNLAAVLCCSINTVSSRRAIGRRDQGRGGAWDGGGGQRWWRNRAA
jgi:hypothetical protein